MNFRILQSLKGHRRPLTPAREEITARDHWLLHLLIRYNGAELLQGLRGDYKAHPLALHDTTQWKSGCCAASYTIKEHTLLHSEILQNGMLATTLRERRKCATRSFIAWYDTLEHSLLHTPWYDTMAHWVLDCVIQNKRPLSARPSDSTPGTSASCTALNDTIVPLLLHCLRGQDGALNPWLPEDTESPTFSYTAWHDSMDHSPLACCTRFLLIK